MFVALRDDPPDTRADCRTDCAAPARGADDAAREPEVRPCAGEKLGGTTCPVAGCAGGGRGADSVFRGPRRQEARRLAAASLPLR
ncbi:hypothetical protein BPORC_1807 [Bifidobacterium porcinum]|nr:hypothetical protein BPORC_1807 [Bifidobacterium porcinum]